MKWLCPTVVLVVTAMGILSTDEIETQMASEQIKDSDEIVQKELEFTFGSHRDRRRSYSMWSRWSNCQAGWKTRRRHCIHRRRCGDALRVEVAKCKNFHEPSQSTLLSNSTEDKSSHVVRLRPEKRQMQVVGEVQKYFRGFSPWSEWTNCSRKCTTVRRRHCLKRSICGRKIIRQSAYCYLEGSYCHHWIRTRMQRRKDPATHQDSEYSLVESIPPALAIHPEDSKFPRIAEPECGKLGRYRGNAAARLRYRMRDMIRIIGGRPAPPGKWPWQVVVMNRFKEPFCGGTLVGLRWVVTAAHCVRRRLYVRLGEHDLLLRNRGELELRVTESVIHPNYDPDTVVNDVALLRLPAPARPDLGHGIACLPPPMATLPPHSACVILGWGKKRPTDIHGTRVLHEAQVSTIQQGVCRRSYWQYAITDDMVCAGRGRRDSCAGDSGGPLLCRGVDHKYYLQGITSFGDGCGKRGKYGIYTRTAGYVAWMQEVMSKIYFD